MNPVGIYVPVSAVFPGTENDFATFRELLKGLSLTDTLFWCARLNLIVSNPKNLDHRAKQGYGIGMFFSREEIERIEVFARERGEGGMVVVFFRGQLLELIRWAVLFCRDHPNDGESLDKPEARTAFAKVALIAGDLWSQRIYEGRFTLEGGLQVARVRGLGASRRATEETSSGMDPLVALGRGKAIFMDHLPPFSPGFIADFQSRVSLSLDDYYLCLCALMTSFLDRTPEKVANDAGASGMFHVDKVCEPARHMAPLFARYLSLESQTADELRAALWGNMLDATPETAGPYNLKPLRQRPILRAPDGRAIILDPVLFSERASAGALFLVSQGASRDEGNRLFGAFGNAFETYTHGILGRMYPDASPLLANRLTRDFRGTDPRNQEVQIADALVDYGNEVVLLEMKAAWVRDDAVLGEDYETYLGHLRERYGALAAGGDRPKGVAQLARAIRNLASGDWSPLGRSLRPVRVIYPVLLVHDAMLNAPLHSAFLASEFRAALVPDKSPPIGNMQKGPFLVAPLIVMTIEDLENLETSVEGFSLLELLRDYSRECADRLVSLNNFLATSPDYKSRLKHSRSVAEKTLDVLEDTMKRVFGKDPRGGPPAGRGG